MPDDRFSIDHWKLRDRSGVLARRYATADEAIDLVLRGFGRPMTLVAFNRFGKVVAEFTRRVHPESFPKRLTMTVDVIPSLPAIRGVLASYRSTDAHVTEEQITAAWAEYEAARAALSTRGGAMGYLAALATGIAGCAIAFALAGDGAATAYTAGAASCGVVLAVFGRADQATHRGSRAPSR